MSKSRAQNKVLNELVLTEPVPDLKNFQPINDSVQKEKNHIAEEEKVVRFSYQNINFPVSAAKVGSMCDTFE